MISLTFLLSTVAGAAILLVAILASDISETMENRRRAQLLREKGLLPPNTKHVPATNVKFTPRERTRRRGDTL